MFGGAIGHFRPARAIADRIDLPVHLETIVETRHRHGDDILASGMRPDFRQQHMLESAFGDNLTHGVCSTDARSTTFGGFRSTSGCRPGIMSHSSWGNRRVRSPRHPNNL